MTATAYAKLAKRVWLKNYEFGIEIREPSDPVFREESAAPDDMPAEGLTDTEKRRIYVAAGLELRRLVEVVWHEIQHAINWVNDVEPAIAKFKGDATEAEELIAEVSGIAWTTFFLDNPRMQQWFTRVFNQIRREREHA